MALDFTGDTGPRTYFHSGNAPVIKEKMTLADFDPNDLIKAQCATPKHIGGTEHFYSCAQHTLIGSYLAEDLYGREIAGAYIGITVPAHYMGNLNRELIRNIPELSEIETNIGRALYEAYQFNPDLWRCEQIEHIEALVTAVEFRDLKPMNMPPADLPPARADIVINPMSPGQVYHALTERIRDVIPVCRNMDFVFDHLSAHDICFKHLGTNRA